MPRAATPAAEQRRRQKIAAAMRGRAPLAALAASHTPQAQATRSDSLRAYWATVPADQRAARARRMVMIREVRRADAIERVFAAALAAIRRKNHIAALHAH